MESDKNKNVKKDKKVVYVRNKRLLRKKEEFKVHLKRDKTDLIKMRKLRRPAVVL